MYNNRFQLIGRLAKDPTIFDGTDEKKAVAFLDIAIDKKDGADFGKITAFGQTVNFIKEYIPKGTLVVINGRIDFSNKVDVDGKAATIVPRLIADEINILSKPHTEPVEKEA